MDGVLPVTGLVSILLFEHLIEPVRAYHNYFSGLMKTEKKNDKERISQEIEKSWSEIEFEFAREMVRRDYKKLKRAYS